MNQYGLTMQQFTRYKEYFFKILNNLEIQNELDSEKSVNQKHDKSFKNIFIEKEEMKKFLQQFAEIDVKAENLEQQKNNYINKQFEKRESDIIYKIKSKEIYILLEHQSKVDKKMPRRIFEYCMGIMLAIEKNYKEDKGTNPIIIPIVIYTGKEKWKVKTNFSDTQKNYEGYEKYKINLNYKLIDINKYSKEKLLEKGTKFAYMLMLEKCQTKEELIDVIVEILLRAQNDEIVEWMEQLIKYVFIDKLGKEGNKIIEILKEGEASDMEDLLERIEINEARIKRNLINKGIKKGILENMTNVIKNMLQNNEDEEKIMKYTNAKKEDIEKIKEKLKKGTK